MGFFTMLIGKSLACLYRMILGVHAMGVGEVRVMCALAGIFVLQMLGRFFMVLGGMLVMLDCFLMMLMIGSGRLGIHRHNYSLIDRG
jgi:hypothetical protein